MTTGLRFSAALQRLQQRARDILRNAREHHPPTVADADAVSSWVAAIGVEFDAVYAELESLRRQIRGRDDHMPDIPVTVGETVPGTVR